MLRNKDAHVTRTFSLKPGGQAMYGRINLRLRGKETENVQPLPCGANFVPEGPRFVGVSCSEKTSISFIPSTPNRSLPALPAFRCMHETSQ